MYAKFVSRDRLLLSYSFAAIKCAAGVIRDSYEDAKVNSVDGLFCVTIFKVSLDKFALAVIVFYL